jgi:hypothetical protein
MNRPALRSCPDPACPYAEDAKVAALEAIETSGGALGLASKSEMRLTAVEKAVVEIMDEQKAGNRKTLLAVASIGFVGVLITAVATIWGQRMAIIAGASQANVGAAQAVQSGQPATRDTYLAGYKDGASIEGAKIRDTLLAQVPIVKSPDVIAKPNKHR